MVADCHRLALLVLIDGEEKQMRTIGLIGGLSWESSLEYYRNTTHKGNVVRCAFSGFSGSKQNTGTRRYFLA